jgi:hypothetical protein
VKAELHMRSEYFFRHSGYFPHSIQFGSSISSFQEAANLPIMTHINPAPIVLFNMLKTYFNIIFLLMNKFSN